MSMEQKRSSKSIGITLRVGKGQGEALAKEALAAGYGSISAWLRTECLGLDARTAGDVVRVQLDANELTSDSKTLLQHFLSDSRRRKPKKKSKNQETNEQKTAIEKQHRTVNLEHRNILNNANQFLKHLHQQSHRNLISQNDMQVACLYIAEIRHLLLKNRDQNG